MGEGVRSRLTQPGSLLPRIGGDFSIVRLSLGPAQVGESGQKQAE